MFKEVILLIFAAISCHAGTTSQGVLCGDMPNNLISCIGLPSLFVNGVVAKCRTYVTPCSNLKCLLTEAGCIKDGKIDKQKTREYFDMFLKHFPIWNQAVNHVKAACLGNKTLPAQGILLDCPEFDVLHCAMTSFIQNVPASQWVQSAQCEATRLYAESCPICPNECFAAQVPNDSCHACLALPRSA